MCGIRGHAGKTAGMGGILLSRVRGEFAFTWSLRGRNRRDEIGVAGRN
jgi:hypothetical protein